MLTFGGDISLADNYATIPYLEHKDGNIDLCIPNEWQQIMKDADVAMLNLENPISNRGTPMPHKTYTYVGKTENTELLNIMVQKTQLVLLLLWALVQIQQFKL